MSVLIKELFSIVLAFVIFYGVIPYGICMVLKQKNIQKEEAMRQKNFLKSHSYLDKYN